MALIPSLVSYPPSSLASFFLLARQGDNEYPGCAFTRSLGDEVAESIGCISEPEVISVDLDPATARFVMLASDGVFEFLTNAQVCDIIQPVRLYI